MAGEPPFDFHDHRPWTGPIEGDELISPIVVGPGLARMARQPVFIGHNTADEAQLGAIIVIPDGRVPSSHISSDASGVASPAELLAAIAAIEPARRSHVDRTREPADRARGLA